MVVALHHTSACFESQDEAPESLITFLDGRWPLDDTQDFPGPMSKRRKTSGARAASTTPKDEHKPETTPHRKRPKSSSRQASQSPVAAFESREWLTLARVDVTMTFEKNPSESCPSPPSDKGKEERHVAVKEFWSIGQGDFSIKIFAEGNQPLFNGTMRSKDVPGKTINVLQQAAKLLSQRNSSARASCMISKSLVFGQKAQTMDFEDGNNATQFDLCVRILVPEYQAMAVGLALPRNEILDVCLPECLAIKKESFSPRDFYDNVYVPDRNSDRKMPIVNELACTLLPFQGRAINWLLEREADTSKDSTDAELEELPHGFVRAIDGDGRSCYISRFLGLITTSREKIRLSKPKLRGGILAEEMGLGKTVEMIALMCLHKQPTLLTAMPPIDGLRRSPATLIITPPAILEQWKNEILTLAPNLKVYTYGGLRVEAETGDDEELMRRCLTHDIVLTTFNVLAKEIHYAESTERNLRHEKRYEKRLSPLTKVLWWRVILDEAQMIESGVSNQAKVANMIPRENAWCVSGTPVKKDVYDIFGLFLFLRYEPYCEIPKSWIRLVTEHKDVFKQMVGRLALRHTKEQIKDEIKLPAQKRVVITVPFTQIEEQHYSAIFQEMAEDCGLDVKGGPLNDAWDPDARSVIEKMRLWLTRLRQTCLHPEVGARNRKALGGKGPLRTVSEVLEIMIEQNHTAARMEERVLLLSQLRRGQILEHAELTQEALGIWRATLQEVEVIVQECRDQLDAEIRRSNAAGEASKATENEDPDDSSSRLGPYRLRLRAALEFEHMCVFFTANAYYQLKTKEGKVILEEAKRSDPSGPATGTGVGVGGALNNDAKMQEGYEGLQANAVTETADKTEDIAEEQKSDQYRHFERLENSSYDRAKSLRKEILSEARKKADSPINKIKEKAQDFARIPAVPAMQESRGGIESRRVFEKLENLLAVTQTQSEQLVQWREKTIELLTVSLVDEADSENLLDPEVGKEYETSTKQQEEGYVYVDALRALVSDRSDIVTGQQNLLIEHEMKVAFAEAKDGRGHAPQLLRELLSQRTKLKPTKDLGSVRGLLSELRELKISLKGQVERNNARAAAEHVIINSVLMKLQHFSTEQSKAVTALEKEVELFKEAMNLRLDYYRQLQAISDSVAPYEHNLSERERNNVLHTKEAHEKYLRSRISTLKAKGRYLLHLREEAADSGTERMCIICQTPFENGILTSCGHSYCLECTRIWWNQHRRCPTCKKELRRQDFHHITYKPAELTMEEEAGSSSMPTKKDDFVDNTNSSGIYSGIREPILNQIKNIDLDGSFGTKIDTIARHMQWIREHDPGAKSIIFSQYKDFLDVLARAFKQFKIGCTGIDRKGGIQAFKNDPGMECFFLHAKAHSSGLNLVNATHVFLCEPLINTAIELQAIARVHRIGQRNETTVWMYLVEGTVEKSIYDISVQRRLAHMGQLQTKEAIKDSRAALEGKIEAANTFELEETPLSTLLTKGSGGGEMVPKDDLWNCLFRQNPGQPGRVSQEARMEVARHLGADAAETRREEHMLDI